TIALEPGERVAFESGAFGDRVSTDAWDLFALRELLSALAARTDPTVQELARDLDRPMWDALLEHLVALQGTAAPAREWCFAVAPSRGHRLLEIAAFSRDLRHAGDKRSPGRWKPQRFDALLAEGATDDEREIGRMMLRDPAPSGRGARATRAQVSFVALGTPVAHDVLRILARHPRVSMCQTLRGSPESDPPVEIVAGLLTMTLERASGDALTPRFRVNGEPLPAPLESLSGERGSLFRWRLDERRIVAIEVPPPLRPWVDLAIRLGDRLAFPLDAVPKLALATQSLTSAGLVELPRVALGDELPYEPAAALRIAWKTDGKDVEAVVEVMIKVHPRAPFAPAGGGAKLFTFAVGEERFFVERELARELQIAGRTVDAIDVEGLAWERGVGVTDGVEPALALARWLDENPLGLAIEVKVGRPPTVRELPRNTNIVVRKTGSWLRLDGTLDLGGVKLTLGEMLEAARLAQRYVRAGDGVFLELSDDARAKLRPLATAARLAPAGVARGAGGAEAPGALLHEGFGALLARAADLFGRVEAKGIDLDEYRRRFESRDRRVRVPALESGALRDYQREGVAWMLSLASWAPGCVLADDMGLGKTVQTAAVLKARAKRGPALIVAPASVSSNWVSELARFMPSLAVRWYNEDRTAPLGELGAGDVLIVSYGLLQRESATFREQHWATVVVDEAQYVKNIEAQRSDAVRSLPRDFTIALTGTPLENHLGELFSIVDIAFPGLLGDEPSFREIFRRPIEAHRDKEQLATLGLLVGPFLLRRTRASVLAELPPREEITEQIELSLPERKRYLALRDECAKALSRKRSRATPSQLKIALLAALMRLRQMACDVGLVDPDYDGPSTKIARVVELVRELAAEGNRALVFSQFTQFLDKVRAALASASLRVATLTGETPTTERRAIVEAFQAGEYDVFCVSLLAGGTGLNLTKASYVIHLDPWWNPAVEEQATARAHRMGQTNPVTVYRLVARGTIEEAVLEMHADKRDLASAVLDGKATPKPISSAELLELLRFGG
ncbi:MAG: DEAD/DEAH box helicase, partial [Labilithrix sp.]|nr:DEAD/DEAH box helicase [Labilithrix sp.]